MESEKKCSVIQNKLEKYRKGNSKQIEIQTH